MKHAPDTKRWRRRYQTLLQFYPAGYRREYEASMLQLFDDLLRDALAQQPESVMKVIRHAFVDTVVSIAREQASALMRLLTRRPDSASPGLLFFARHRTAFIATTAALVVVAASWLGGFWSYSGPFGYAQRVLQIGIAQERYAGNWNAGWDDVAANFVADYVQAKYFNSGRTNVGYKSPHALKNRIVTIEGQPRTFGLERTISSHYASTQPGFDPLVCSTEAPVAVRYVREAVTQPGEAVVIAAFTYASGGQSNLARYALQLDLSESAHGAWKIADVSCISLEARPDKPYTSSLSANENARRYDERNNRDFGVGL